MNAALTDVQQTLSYGHGKLALKSIALAAGLGTLGLFVLYVLYFDDDLQFKDRREAIISGWALALFSILLLARELYKLASPGEPLLILRPDGLKLNIDGFTFVHIPWTQVHGLATIDVATRATVYTFLSLDKTGNTRTEIAGAYRQVTAVLISRDFFETSILPAKVSIDRRPNLVTILKIRDGMVDHLRARRGLGTGWDSIFIFGDGEMNVALHHSILPITRDHLRTAVEARWRAFGAAPAARQSDNSR